MNRILTALVLVVAFTQATAAQTVTKLEGQIICCTDCWTRTERKTVPYGTLADLTKAADCISKGDPTLIAVLNSDGTTWFYQLDEGKYKKPGKTWLELVGARVEITGTTRSKRDKHFVRIDELKVIATPDQIAPQANVIGTEVEVVLRDPFGAEQKLSSYRGRVVVLNFWATWCGPCRKEMPDLAAIQNQYAALGVQVIGAAADTLAQQKEVRAYIKDVNVNFPIWLGAATEDMARFGLGPALPGTAVIGRDGKILAIFHGVIRQADLKKQLDTLIAKSQREAKEQIASAKPKPPERSSVPS